MRLRDSAIVGQLITRISGLIFSFGILLTLGHNLNLLNFSLLQICIAGIGICLWVLDFGSSSSLILNQGNNQPDKSRELLGLRILILSVTFIVLTICALIFIDLKTGLLISILSCLIATSAIRVSLFTPGFYQTGLSNKRVSINKAWLIHGETNTETLKHRFYRFRELESKIFHKYELGLYLFRNRLSKMSFLGLEIISHYDISE